MSNSKQSSDAVAPPRDGLIYATLATIAAAVLDAAKVSGPLPLLALPLVGSLLGWTYLANHRKITDIGAYLRAKVIPRVEEARPGSTGCEEQRNGDWQASR